MSEPLQSVAEIQAFCDQVPFNVWLGVRIVAASATGVELELPWRDEMMGSPTTRTAHGGILGAVLDATAGLSLLAAVGRVGPAIDLRIDFHRPLAGGGVRGRGRLLRAGNAITSVEAFLYDFEDRLVASGRGVFFTQLRPS